MVTKRVRNSQIILHVYQDGDDEFSIVIERSHCRPRARVYACVSTSTVIVIAFCFL